MCRIYCKDREIKKVRQPPDFYNDRTLRQAHFDCVSTTLNEPLNASQGANLFHDKFYLFCGIIAINLQEIDSFFQFGNRNASASRT